MITNYLISLSEGQIALIVLWSLVGAIVYMSTFENLNSELKRPIWAIFCGPLTIAGTIVYWIVWTFHFFLFKSKNNKYSRY